MKVRQAVIAAVAASAAAAQSVSFTTVTYEECPSVSLQTVITVTHGVTATYCPACVSATSAAPAPTGYTTIYTTVYQSLCSTGLVPITHTITESCSEPTPTWTQGADYVPPGFTVIEKECGVCGKATPTVTLTEPCDCEATSGVSIGPTPTGTSPRHSSPEVGHGGNPPVVTTTVPCKGTHCAASDHGNQQPASSAPACGGNKCGTGNDGHSTPGKVSQIPDGQIQAPTSAVSQIPDGQVQAPYPSGAKAHTSANSTGTKNPITTSQPSSEAPLEPTTNAASSPYSLGLLASCALAIFVGALAFAL